MKRVLTSLLLASALAFGGATAAKTAKPAAKPQPKLGAIGTSQLPGDWCDFGKAYTLGRASHEPINFAFLKADYRATRIVRADTDYDYPLAGEKLLIVHFSLHNPTKETIAANGAVNIIAVDDQGTNHPWDFQCLDQSGNLSGAADTSPRATLTAFRPGWAIHPPRLAVDTTFSKSLLPAQKLYAFAIFHLPRDRKIVKVIVSRTNDSEALVARYDTREHITPLAVPFADPADKTGATAIATIPGEVGKICSVGLNDITVEKVEFVTKPITDEEVGQDEAYAVVTMQWKSFDTVPQHMPIGSFTLKDADGAECSLDYPTLAATSNRELELTIQPGETARFRSVFKVHKGVALKALVIEWSPVAPISFDMSAFTAP